MPLSRPIKASSATVQLAVVMDLECARSGGRLYLL
jgi:hypothetical protein